MNTFKKKRIPRTKVFQSTDWRSKVHPFLVRMLEYNKRVVDLRASTNRAERAEGERLFDNPPGELLAEAERMHDAIPESDRPRHDAHLSIYGAVDSRTGTVISEDQFTLCWLAWSRYGKTIQELIAGDRSGHEKSSKQLASVTKDYNDWRYGKLDPNKLSSKFDYNHLAVMRCGLDLGIETLTQEELTDCFDEICTCGKEHDGEKLRKLRTRTIEMIRRLQKVLSPPSS